MCGWLGQAEAQQPAASPAAGSAPSLSILVVDVQALLQNSKSAKMVRQQIEQKRTEYAKEISHQEEALRQERDSLQRQQASLSSEALNQKEIAGQRAARLSQDAEQQQRMAGQLQDKVQQLKTAITSYENELVTLRARAKTAESTKKINQHLAKVDSSSTIAMLERMKQKVEEDEALAQAYGEVGQVDTSVDTEINKALASSQPSKAQDQLQAMKAKLGITS